MMGVIFRNEKERLMHHRCKKTCHKDQRRSLHDSPSSIPTFRTISETDNSPTTTTNWNLFYLFIGICIIALIVFAFNLKARKLRRRQQKAGKIWKVDSVTGDEEAFEMMPFDGTYEDIPEF